VPWMPGRGAPGANAWIAAIDQDPVKNRFPTYEFTADIRLNGHPLLAIRAIRAEAEKLLGASDRSAASDRSKRWAETSATRKKKLAEEAMSKAKATPVDPMFVSHTVMQSLDDNCLVLDESLRSPRFPEFVTCSQPGSYIHNPGSSGGWGPGAALGAKIAAPDKDVVLVTGDGFWQFAVPSAALWASSHHRAPFLSIIHQNRSFSTGTTGVKTAFGEAYAHKADYPGGYFDPPIDYAKEAEACGAYGENVRDPAELGPAIKRGLAQTRRGTPAVIAVWEARLNHSD
jgi:acetolactate synthase I/II/III large subunit